ncbi:MAG TPA: ectoine/hydroxyectoine ABC transporter substrate-binding protein EhuB [Pseudonocardia sp.]|jgi:polar amino acid transport system substrate-binding protein|uniref:ectoine/hydroxyectoine ABC transporter substrate-binding protein EhuB n=1 Tax=Pseudonocardia sp. TaxID=60912 RepID=UPI002C42953E|nr:ectoine/hydroxyectoine ABC transporter substrate-binding protein EhuB [Pseudonocardia sp.]HTF53370.1 ectoine/hydroxyectoine ABC transporter substrate-binding protein EhuB [Pseudonocardia sp.]
MLSRRRLLTVAGVGVLAAGCGPDHRSTLKRLQANETVRVGVANEEPFGYLDSYGRLAGESPEVATAVLKGLGITSLEAVQRPFGQLIDSLLAGTFDIITAGMAITPGRCERVAFSRPDFVAPTAFLVERGNPRRLRSFADVARAGELIAVLDASIEQEAARAAGIPDARIKPYDSPAQLYQAVFQGDAPAGALTDISLRNLLGRHPQSPLEVTPGLPPSGRSMSQPAGAFAFRPTDTDLRDAFNAGLTELQRSGEWLRIVARFGATAANLPAPDLITERLCQSG